MTKRIKLKREKVKVVPNDFTPALHPRDPETGKFVERPYSVPDDIVGMDTRDIISELQVRTDNFDEQVEGVAVDLQQGTTRLSEVDTGDTVVSQETGEEFKVVDTVTPPTLSTQTGLVIESDGEEREISNQEWGEDNEFVLSGDEQTIPTEIQDIIDDVETGGIQSKLDVVTEDDSIQITFVNDEGQEQTTQALDVSEVFGLDNTVAVEFQGQRFGTISSDDGGVFRPQQGEETREVVDIEIQ